MKKLMLAFLFCPLLSCAQYITESPVIPIDATRHKIDYQAVIKVDSLTKEQIYSCAREWLNRSFSIGHFQISMDDFNSGHLIARGTVFGSHDMGIADLSTGFTISFILDLKVKNGAYKYEITDFNILFGIDRNKLPDWRIMDDFAIDPKFKNSKGEYTGREKQFLGVLDGNMQYMISDLKASIHDRLYSYKIVSDF